MTENKNEYRIYKKTAKRLMNYIISNENINKKLIAESMDEIETELSELNSKKKMFKTYLDTNANHRQMGVNLVS